MLENKAVANLTVIGGLAVIQEKNKKQAKYILYVIFRRVVDV